DRVARTQEAHPFGRAEHVAVEVHGLVRFPHDQARRDSAVPAGDRLWRCHRSCLSVGIRRSPHGGSYPRDDRGTEGSDTGPYKSSHSDTTDSTRVRTWSARTVPGDQVQAMQRPTTAPVRTSMPTASATAARLGPPGAGYRTSGSSPGSTMS